MLCRPFLVDIVVVHKKKNNKCQYCDLNNCFQCAPKHLLRFFFVKKMRVCLSVLGAAKTESGYNTRWAEDLFILTTTILMNLV